MNIIWFLYWEKFSLHKYIIFYADRCIWGRKLWHGSIWQFFPISVAHMIRSLLAVQETWVWSLGWEDPLEECMAIHSSVLSWRIPWTEKPGELQSMGSHRVGHDWATNTHTHARVDRSIWGRKLWPWIKYDNFFLYSYIMFIARMHFYICSLIFLPQFFLTIMIYGMTWNTMIHICRWQKNLINVIKSTELVFDVSTSTS